MSEMTGWFFSSTFPAGDWHNKVPLNSITISFGCLHEAHGDTKAIGQFKGGVLWHLHINLYVDYDIHSWNIFPVNATSVFSFWPWHCFHRLNLKVCFQQSFLHVTEKPKVPATVT